MKPARLIIVAVVGLALVGGALFVLGSKRSDRIEELTKQAQSEARYKRADAYFKGSEADKKYVDELFVYATETARSDLNGFFAPPPGPERYYAVVYQTMIHQARDQGKAEIAKSLHTWVLGQGYLDVKP